MSDITYRLNKGAELTFGELDRNFGSLDSDMVALSDRFDSFASERGLDSARTIRIITDTVDSDLVQLRYEKLDIFRDSGFVIEIIDSMLDSLGLKSLYSSGDHDSDTLVQVDSAYVRFRADSDYIQSAADSDHIKSIADSDYIHSAADSDHVKSIVDSDYIKFVADSSYVERIAEGVSGLDSQNVWDLLDGEARHLLPQSTETYDLGSNLQRWRDLYVRDAYISTTTIYLGTTDSPQRSSISVDSGGNFALTSPTSTGLIATSTTGTALDSNVILSLVDSAYVQSRQNAGGGGLDSAGAIDLIDIRIINGLATIDSDYVQSRQVDVDTVRDSAFVSGIVDAAYVQQRVRGPEMVAGGRIKTTSSGLWTQNGDKQKQLFGIFDSGQAPGGTDGIFRSDTGIYRFQFDSANLSRITSGDDYTVMVTYDYGRDDPTASSRTLSVFAQEDSSFQVVLERSDAGTNENYSDDAHINFQVWLY